MSRSALKGLPSDSKALLHTVGLVKMYQADGVSVEAVRGVDIDVGIGEFVAIMGPSGSGKSTLLHVLGGLEKASRGEIWLRGQRVDKLSTAAWALLRRRHVGFMFQFFNLLSNMTVADNVELPALLAGASPKQARKRREELLAELGLSDKASAAPARLSGGEQQRVALARALIADTGLILCDEPLSNLDADLRERMRVEISTLVREAAATTVYITHDQAEAFALADQVGVLENGRLVQQGTPEQIYAEPATPFVARFTGLAGELPAQVKERRPDGTVLVEPAGGIPFLARSRPAPDAISSPDASTSPNGSSSPGSAISSPNDVVVLIRPAGVRLCPVGAAADGQDGHHLTGRVTDVAFRGRGYEHAIQVGTGGTRLTSVLADVKVPRGATVGVRLDLAGCHAFPASSR